MRLRLCLAALSMASVACGHRTDADRMADCTDEVLEVDGVTYSPDPDRGCVFVDPDGNVLKSDVER